MTASERRHLGALTAITVVTAYFSYAYFHIDEYFQVLELVRFRNGDIGEPLAWEVVGRLRPWLQPMIYYGFVRVLGLHDPFTMAFVLRLVTGLANVGSVALLLRTTLPWLPSDDAKRRHLRVLTLLGFLPYLFVRTSSESASMAALTAGFALLLENSEQDGDRWTLSLTPLRSVLGGFLLGCAFEFRFQTAIATAGILGWLAWQRGRLPLVLAGIVASLGLGALADRWGYGTWEFPAWTYFQVNLVEGAAGTFGTSPPFAYLWMTPANIFAPVVIALMVTTVLAWKRSLRHPLTAATLPFVLVHCLISHKEERFLFPVLTLVVALAAFAGITRTSRVLAAWSCAGMALLAFVPLGWHTNVRFIRFAYRQAGDDFHAIATPEINLGLPPFRPRVYDLKKGSAEEIARQVDAHTAPAWLIMDRPDFKDAPALEGKATLVFSELPFADDPEMRAREMRWVDAYNAWAPAPLRQVYYRSLFRLGP